MAVYRHTSHAVFLCDYSTIWCGRPNTDVKLLNEDVLAYHPETIKGPIDVQPNLIVKEINGESDYIHILISIPSQRSAGEVVRIIKACTARDFNKKFPT